MTNPSSNVIFTRHIYFLNFDELHMDKSMSFSNLQKPLRKRKVEYINLIRNPVDRFVSKFYHRRHGDYGSAKSIITSINSTLDINTCVNLNLSECPERLQSICLEDHPLTLNARPSGRDHGPARVLSRTWPPWNILKTIKGTQRSYQFHITFSYWIGKSSLSIIKNN